MNLPSWITLFLALIVIELVHTLQVKNSLNLYQNATDIETNKNLTVILADSELSASERTRRLIPYMAFYLPAADIPINQKYILPRQKLAPQPGIDNQKSHIPVGHIPVPTAYMHVKVPEETELTYAHNYHDANIAHPYHHSIVYHDQNIETPKNGNKKPSPVYQLLPPASSPSAPSVLLPSAYVPHKQKTIQHFPPTTAASRYQAAQQQHSEIYRERQKHTNINFTPFTESNTLPGHFVPIIYTSKHNSNDEDFQPPLEQPRFKNVVQRLPQKQIDANDYVMTSQQQPHEPHIFLAVTASPAALTGETVIEAHQADSNFYQLSNEEQQQPQQQALQSKPQIISTAKLQQLQQQQQLQQEEKSAQYHRSHNHHAAHKTHFQPSKPDNFYPQQTDEQLAQLLNADYASTPQDKYVLYLQQRVQSHKQQQPKQTLQTSSPNRQHHHYHHQHPTSYSKHQQQHNQYKQPTYTKAQRDYAKQQYNKQHRFSQPIYVSSTPTTASLENDSPQEVHINYAQPPPARHATYGTNPKLSVSPHQQHHSQIAYSQAQQQQQQQQLQQQHHQQQKQQQQQHHQQQQQLQQQQHQQQQQQQHNHQQQQQQQHNHQEQEPQVFHANDEIYFNIPVRNMIENVAVLQNQPHTNQFSLHQHSQLNDAKNSETNQQHQSSLLPKYIEYVIQDPKQSLDEEQHQNAQPQPTVKPVTSETPQAAYIVVTTTAPYHAGQLNRPKNTYGSTLRPAYKQRKPTLRLQPVAPRVSAHYKTKTITTLQPKPFMSNENNQAKYVYVSTKPTYTELLYEKPTVPIKLKNEYAYVTPNTLDDQTPKEDTQPPYQTAIKPTATTIQENQADKRPTKNYYTEPNQLPDIRSSSLADILHKLQESNHLPHTLTPDNIDNSIKTLITILNNLKETQTIVAYTPTQHHEATTNNNNNDDYTTESEETVANSEKLNSAGPNKYPGPSTGRAGVDYPNYAEIPQTSFDCGEQRYKGFFGDPETNCQVWHYCDLNGGKASFLCPNGTIFSQIALTCDWWFNVKCSTTAQLYVLNERLYKYILPFNPKFPEDYSGPIVDKYLAMKFQEMEEKMRIEKQKALEEAKKQEKAENALTEDNLVTEETAIKSSKPKGQQNTSIQSESAHNSQTNTERNLLNDVDVDDIAQRGTIDTYEINTEQEQLTVTAATEMPPFSVKPIVVSSSTMEPDFEMLHQSEHEQSTRSNSAEVLQLDKKPKPITNITVEKVEVIEIKSDGNTGHLSPEFRMNNRT